MNSQSISFRSKTDREREVHLEKNYRKIGIPALAAASNPCCKTTDEKRAGEKKRRTAPAPHSGSAATD